MSAEWTPFEAYGQALFDFVPTVGYQLALTAGDTVCIVEEAAGWYRGSLTTKPEEEGIFPAAYVKLLNGLPQTAAGGGGAAGGAADSAESKSPGTPAGGATFDVGEDGPSQAERRAELLFTKVDQTIRQWHDRLDLAMVCGRIEEYHDLLNRLSQLTEWRRMLLASSVPVADKERVKLGVLRLIEASGQMQEGILLPLTDNDELANESNTNVAQLADMHRDMQQRLEQGAKIPQSASEQLLMEAEMGLRVVASESVSSAPSSSTDDLMQLVMEYRSSQLVSDEPLMLYFGLWTEEPEMEASRPSVSSDGTPLSPRSSVQLTGVRRPVPSLVRRTTLVARLRDAGSQLTLRPAVSVEPGSGDMMYEEVVLPITAQGAPQLTGTALAGVFANVSRTQVSAGHIYLICSVFRSGSLVAEEKMVKGSPEYRRPVGSAVVKLSPSLTRAADGALIQLDPLVIQTPQKKADEFRFFDMHGALIGGSDTLASIYTPSTRISNIVISLRPFHSTLPNLIANNDAFRQFAALPVARPLLFRHLRAVDVFEVRNELYVTLLSCDVSQDNKIAQRNVQIRVNLVRADGTRLPCLLRGAYARSSPRTEYQSAVYYHSNVPVFNETVCVRIPNEGTTFENSHLLFSLYHVSSKASKTACFAFAILPLASARGVAIADGLHELPCFKPYKGMEVEGKAPLYLPNCATMEPRGDIMYVFTRLVSGSKTSRTELYELLHWRSMTGTALVECLRSLVRLPAADAARFFKDICDNLFDIMICDWSSQIVEDTGTAGEDVNIITSRPHSVILMAFELFVLMVTRLRDEYPEFVAAVDTYIAKHIRHTWVYQVFIACTRHILDTAVQSSGGKLSFNRADPLVDLSTLVQQLDYVMKFVVSSYALAVDSHMADDAMAPQLKITIALLQQLVALAPTPRIAQAQLEVQARFVDVMEAVMAVLPLDESGVLIRSLLQTPADEESLRQLSLAQQSSKLTLMKRLVNSVLLRKSQIQDAVIETVVRVLIALLDERRDLSICRMCIDILTDLVKLENPRNVGNLSWYLSMALPQLCSAIVYLRKSSTTASTGPSRRGAEQSAQRTAADQIRPAVVCLLSLVYTLTEAQLKHLLSVAFGGNTAQLQFFVDNILNVCVMITTQDLFAESWLTLRLLQRAVVAKILAWVSPSLGRHFNLSPPDDETCSFVALWRAYFQTGMMLLRDQLVNPELMPPEWQRAIHSKDLRASIAEDLLATWQGLECHKYLMSRQVVASCVELVYSPIPEVVNLGRRVYADVVLSELTETEQLSLNQDLTIDAVDDLVTRGGPEFLVRRPRTEAVTRGELLPQTESLVISSVPTTSAQPLLQQYLAEIRLLYDMLMAGEQYPHTADFEDERTDAALTLISYLQRTGKYSMYIRHVRGLSELHFSLSNKAEFARTHLLHANMLTWSEEKLVEFKDNDTVFFPAETHADRLQRILKESIQHFTDAECWEDAVAVSNVLRPRYQDQIFDYVALGALLRTEAEIVDKMATQTRFFPSYFVVHFYGGDMDPTLTAQYFVFRGAKLERAADFEARLKRKFAGLQKVSNPPADPLAPGKFVTISTVNPCHADEMAGKPCPYSRGNLPARIREGLLHHGADVFTSMKPFRKREQKTGSEVLDSWVRRYFFRTVAKFPTTHRRLAVAEVVEQVMNPFEVAVFTLDRKNLELQEAIMLNKGVEDGQAEQGFTMLLNGVADAAVGGGVKNYEPFLTGSFTETHPEILENSTSTKDQLQSALRETLQRQFELVKEGIAVHEVKCAAEMKALHEHLKIRLTDMETLLTKLGVL